jgi:hypothetical protein
VARKEVAIGTHKPYRIPNIVENFIGTLQGSGGLEKLKKQWFKEALWGKETLRDAVQF